MPIILRRAITFLFFFVSILFSRNTFAQITASDTSGCAPLVGIIFTSPPGATNINWNFDDGASSNLATPTHTFTAPDTYHVVFTATIGGNPVSYSLDIFAYGNPSANFRATTPVMGCIPLTVNFLDSSFGGGGSAIVKREWAFGDGGVNVGNVTAPSYQYTLAGAFTVTLKVTDAHGCDTSFARTSYVKTSVPPNAVITTSPNPPSACLPPLAVSFSGANSTTNSTTGTGLTYFWNFGNNDTTSAVNPPQHNYNALGTYPVTLTVTDNNNCPAIVITNVVISSPLASFYAVGAVHDTVCKRVTFHNTSTGVSPLYTYGDGSTGTDSIHTYANPGTYQVTLQVSAGICTDDTTITIIVENVVANFTSSPTYSCSWPYSVQFTDNSINAATYYWTFGDTAHATIQNPQHTYQNADTNRYTIYYGYTFYNTLLTVTTVHGCSATFSKRDSVFKPTARFMPDKTEGCAPLTVEFSDSSFSKEPIVNWFWNFGDGVTNNAATGAAVTHTYTNPGVYYATLIITNSAGCKDTSFAIPIYVGEPSAPNFSVSPSTVCPNTPVQFTDLTPASDFPNYWHYTADGGIMSHCYNDPDPVWSFNTQTGPQSITLTTVYNGCNGTTTLPNAITVKGPLAHFYPVGNCATPFTYSFPGDIQLADSWTWDFGDGTVLTNSTNTNPSHTYTTTGDYNVTLTAVNNTSGCPPYVDTAIVNVRNIHASFGSDTLTCVRANNIFSSSASQDVYAHCYEGYLWYWGDNKPPTNTALDTAIHSYDLSGSYIVKLVVKDINGCVDSIKQNVKVYGVTSYFKPNKRYGCLPLTVNFTDSSYADTTIASWAWNFGDGTTSNLQSPQHIFTQTGVTAWNVSLTVTDVLGCISLYTLQIRPSVPDSNFTAQTAVNICKGDSVRFIANSTLVTYQWNFGDGGTSTLYNPTHVYNTAGIFNVTLTVTDSIGCVGTKVRTAYVNVQNYPLAGFFSSADTIFNKCYPLLVSYTDTSVVNVFGSRRWDLGNGSAVVGNQTVGTVYQLPGTYNVTLIETTTNGCRDTVSKTLEIEGPVGNFDIAPNSICKGQTITFSIKDTVDVLAYSWDFGDGTTAPGTSPISHTFNINPSSGQTLVSIVMWSPDSACTATKSNPVYITPVIADFSIANNDSIFCLNEPLIFNNLSQNATVNGWTFGDNTSYNGITPPPHTYATPGNYTVTLIISNPTLGCSDTITKNLTIYGIPTATALGGDTCQGNPVQLQSSGGVTYLWTPATDLSSDTISNPLATPSSSIVYTVTVYDIIGCSDTATASVIIYGPVTPVNFDTLLVIGDSVQLNVNQGPGYLYEWSPATGLSCTTCSNPIAHPLESVTYTVTITDVLSCFVTTSTFFIDIKPITTIDVPTAFTPNGNNPIIYAEGLGIKRLLEFKIYNRWGQLLFETDDINKGWDGYYQGKLQNVETYVYTVKAESWLHGQILTKKGSFNLLR